MVRLLKKKIKKGFTLTELLIVITIVTFLATLATVGYINQLRKARDAKRKSHLQKMRLAFEDYYNDWGCYPDGVTFETCDSSDFSPWLPRVYCDDLGENYKVIPQGEDCPSWYAIYTNIEYPKDHQLLANECYEGCTIEEEGYNFVVYSEGILGEELPGLPGSEPLPTPFPTVPAGATNTPTPTVPAGATNTPTPTDFLGPTPTPCSDGCWRMVGEKCNGSLQEADGPCLVNCYTDQLCSPHCWTPSCNL